MKLLRLELRDFRGYDRLIYEPSDGLNIVEGENGSGKTNLVEAIYCLSVGKGWRSNEFAPLIKNGKEFAKITAFGENENGKTKVELIFTKDERRALVNGKAAKKLSELAKLFPMSLFTPSDASLFTGSPKSRRAFLDMAISSKSQSYFEAICRYGKLLAERNSVLKEEKPNRDQIDVIDSQMARECVAIIGSRRDFISQVNKTLDGLANALYGAQRTLRIVYRPFVKGDDIEKGALETFRSSVDMDVVHKTTSCGPHREDFFALLDGKDVGIYGSRGENRIAAIALKLSPSFVQKENGTPIVILDDVYGELDDERARNLTAVLKKSGQVFVTTTGITVTGASYTELHKHNVTRRN